MNAMSMNARMEFCSRWKQWFMWTLAGTSFSALTLIEIKKSLHPFELQRDQGDFWGMSRVKRDASALRSGWLEGIRSSRFTL